MHVKTSPPRGFLPVDFCDFAFTTFENQFQSRCRLWKAKGERAHRSNESASDARE